MAWWFLYRKNGNTNILMPYLTYTLKDEIPKNLNINNKTSLDKFINRIEDLNYKNRAIFVVQNKNIIDQLTKKFMDLSQQIDSGEDQIIRNTIFKLTQTLNESYLCDTSKNNQNIKIDFHKNLENEIDKKLFFNFSKDVFDPSHFDGSVDKFKNNFLDKIKTFIISMNTEKKIIDNICIFHKELSNYLLPWKIIDNNKNFIIDQPLKKSLNDPEIQKIPKKTRSYYPENVKKITEGTAVLFNWWNSISEKFRPSKFLIISDSPFPNLSKTHKQNYQVKNIYQDYLFGDQKNNKFKAKIDFLDKQDLPKNQWWKHKRHFAFGKTLPLLIWSEFGIEFVNERDISKLNNKNQFIIDNNSENEHRKEILEIIDKLNLNN